MELVRRMEAMADTLYNIIVDIQSASGAGVEYVNLTGNRTTLWDQKRDSLLLMLPCAYVASCAEAKHFQDPVGYTWEVVHVAYVMTESEMNEPQMWQHLLKYEGGTTIRDAGTDLQTTTGSLRSISQLEAEIHIGRVRELVRMAEIRRNLERTREHLQQVSTINPTYGPPVMIGRLGGYMYPEGLDLPRINENSNKRPQTFLLVSENVPPMKGPMCMMHLCYVKAIVDQLYRLAPGLHDSLIEELNKEDMAEMRYTNVSKITQDQVKGKDGYLLLPLEQMAMMCMTMECQHVQAARQVHMRGWTPHSKMCYVLWRTA
jgi:hypothetical protein